MFGRGRMAAAAFETIQIDRPSFIVHFRNVLRQATMPQTQERAALFRFEVYFNQGCSGGHDCERAIVGVPTPSEHDAAERRDLGVDTRGDVALADFDPECATRPRVYLVGQPKPSAHQCGIDQEWEYRCRNCSNEDFQLDRAVIAGHLRLAFRSAASAASRNCAR